jgi:hypothetical protein
MCCELFLKYFRDYDEIEETYDDDFDKAVKILYEKERGLVYTTCGMFSERFVRWYTRSIFHFYERV